MTTITRSETPSGNFVYSTVFGQMSATSRMGVGWTLSQWTPTTGTTYLGHFRTIEEVESHIASNYSTVN
jgi:hypothetical protein